MNLQDVFENESSTYDKRRTWGKRKHLKREENLIILNKGGETKEDPKKTFNGGGQKEEEKQKTITKPSITNLEVNIT
jgi:hypothetical protein